MTESLRTLALATLTLTTTRAGCLQAGPRCRATFDVSVRLAGASPELVEHDLEKPWAPSTIGVGIAGTIVGAAAANPWVLVCRRSTLAHGTHDACLADRRMRFHGRLCQKRPLRQITHINDVLSRFSTKRGH